MIENVRSILFNDLYNSFILVRHHVRIANEPYEAAKDAHAIVVCTEWDEFAVKSIKLIFRFY